MRFKHARNIRDIHLIEGVEDTGSAFKHLKADSPAWLMKHEKKIGKLYWLVLISQGQKWPICCQA